MQNVLTVKQLTEKLDAIRGASFVTITSRTEPAMVKFHRETGEPNPHYGATKISLVNGMVNWCYGQSVNNQRLREGNGEHFFPESRRWGQRRFYNAEGQPVYDRTASVRLSPFVDHKGWVYLELKVQNCIEHRYEAPDGTVLTDEDVAPYLPIKGESRQGVEREVILRDYTLDKDGMCNILAITMGGETYHIH
jgi:hypothetical protein